MDKENKRDVFKALDHYIANVVDGRIAYYIKRNKLLTTDKKVLYSLSQPITIVFPLGWHPLKIEKLNVLYQYLKIFGIITCEFHEFETHFIDKSNEKILWIGNQTELMYLISELIHPLNLIPPPAKNNLNFIISCHFRDLNGDFNPEILKVSKSKGVGKKDRLAILNEIIEALK
ncbi:MAG: hypothetical protein NTZ33_15765 [Bacteroidetes bacterium]|nr:hypothetical protein [Bacteroidota bacterium]